MLVVVHHRDVELFDQATLDFKGLRRLNVLEIDAAKRWSNGLHRGNEMVYIRGIYFYIEAVQVSKNLEEYSLAFHHRLGCLRANIPQAQHRSTVGNHCHQISLGRVLIDVFRICSNL